MDYFLADGNTRRGPFPAEQLLGQGMRPDTLVWREGMPQWLRAVEVPELQALLGGAPTVPPQQPYGQPGQGHSQAQQGYPQQQQQQQYGQPYPQYAMPQNNVNGQKVAAGVCGILLGSLGVHKFILGMTTPGVIMLLVSLVGGALTCGVASIIVSVIGIVEGIIYLTKTDQEFQQIYMVEKRPWF